MQWISVHGDRLAGEPGRTVTLAGVGLGGWMNMENFITGYPATESLQRAALRGALDEEGYTPLLPPLPHRLLRRRRRRLPGVAGLQLGPGAGSTTATSRTTTGRSS
jgi:hypothetical protein